MTAAYITPTLAVVLLATANSMRMHVFINATVMRIAQFFQKRNNLNFVEVFQPNQPSSHLLLQPQLQPRSKFF